MSDTIITIEKIKVNDPQTGISVEFSICKRTASNRYVLACRQRNAGGQKRNTKRWSKSLNTTNLKEARLLAPAVAVEFLQRFQISVSQGPLHKKRAKSCPTIDQYCEAFKSWYQRYATAKVYTEKLKRIIRETGNNPETFFLNGLSQDLANEYVASKQGEDAPDFWQKREGNYTIVSDLRNAKACFTPRALSHFSQIFEMPEDAIASFRRVPLPKFSKNISIYTPLPDVDTAAMEESADQLEDENLRLAFWLVRRCGMRPAEIANSQVEWFHDAPNAPYLRVQPVSESGKLIWEPKTDGSTRSIHLDPMTAGVIRDRIAEIRDHDSSHRYLLKLEPNTPNIRIKFVTRKLGAWIRDFIPKSRIRDREHPNKCLRRQHGSDLHNIHNWDSLKISRRMGNSRAVCEQWYIGDNSAAPVWD